eukprot:CAMPEP_0173433694 /NCGR_PEP_ID=MMETSP1357-20121228/11045_1 /TAXON_ID=77926 /ORGANISM="Hemiselmis rufescens, Strain PCC563" /LENGTH=52 /DNA_ID=CAMNT_0014398423 /DNA_START=113 /DNA_END=271 /DNA_ORIENTATION=+
MVFCTKCGTKARDGDKFCASCGAPHAPPQASAPVAQAKDHHDDSGGESGGDY